MDECSRVKSEGWKDNLYIDSKVDTVSLIIDRVSPFSTSSRLLHLISAIYTKNIYNDLRRITQVSPHAHARPLLRKSFDCIALSVLKAGGAVSVSMLVSPQYHFRQIW
jgi:hypothetical protein